jgi:DNA-binding response OmpR family regulator
MKNILLVEDDPFLIDIYTKKLQESGFKVRVVKSGGQVIASLEEEKPDLILLDIVLPEIVGWEVLASIKARKDLAGIKVVVLSNLGQQEEVEKGLRMGAVQYLIKSQYKPSEVVKKVKEILAK